MYVRPTSGCVHSDAVQFNSGNSNVKDKPYSKWPCIIVTPQNEKYLNHLVYVKEWTVIRKLGEEQNIRFNALETMVAML